MITEDDIMATRFRPDGWPVDDGGMHDPHLAAYNSGVARQLMPTSLREQLPSIEDFLRLGDPDPVLHARYATACGRAIEWYVAAATFDSRSRSAHHEDTFLWVYVADHAVATGMWGPASLRALERLHCGCHLGVERDPSWRPRRFSGLVVPGNRVTESIDRCHREGVARTSRGHELSPATPRAG